jgi:pilus assembly protein CpaF
VEGALAPTEDELEELFGDGPLRALLAEREVTEILVNGPAEIWVERGGRLERVDAAFSSEESLKRWVRKVLSERGRKIDHRAPFADCSLGCGSRVHVAAAPVSRRGLCLSLRKAPAEPSTLAALEERKALPPAMAAYLQAAVRAKKNIFFSGGTGTGKTTFLCALLGEVAAHERIIALEDVAEIRVRHPHFLSLEARPANQEGEGEITLRQLLKESLRMRPDRLVIGECRGPEALDLLLALNSGHGGSMGTIHANSPREALQRLETLAQLAAGNLNEAAVKSLVCGGIHLVVQLERTPTGRRVASLAELKGTDGGRFLLREVPMAPLAAFP